MASSHIPQIQDRIERRAAELANHRTAWSMDCPDYMVGYACRICYKEAKLGERVMDLRGGEFVHVECDA